MKSVFLTNGDLASDAIQRLDFLELVGSYSSTNFSEEHWFGEKCAKWSKSLIESGYESRALVPGSLPSGELHRWLRRINPSVLISRAFCLSDAELRLLAEDLTSTSIVQVNHTPNSFMLDGGKSAPQSSLDSLISAIDVPNMFYALVSRKDHDSISRIFPSDKILWWPNPVDLSLPVNPKTKLSDPLKLTIAARASLQKNIKSQIDAVAIVAQQLPVHLSVFCAWEKAEGTVGQLEVYASTVLAKAGATVEFLPFRSGAAFRDFLREETDLLLHCTLDEADSIAVLEAMLLAVPVVCSPTIEYAHLVADPTDIVAISEEVLRAASDIEYFSQKSVSTGRSRGRESQEAFLACAKALSDGVSFE